MSYRLCPFQAVLVALATALVIGACDRGSGERAEARPSSEKETKPPEKESGKTAAPAAKKEDDRYDAVLEPGEVPVGETAEVELSLKAGEGLHVNREYPTWTLELESPSGIELGKSSFEAKDFELKEKSARVQTTLTAAQSGAANIGGTANFSVCNDERCHIMRDESVAFELRVQKAKKE